MREYLIGKNDEGNRVDRFVSQVLPRLPKSLLYKSIRLRRIKLNGKRCEISTRLREGDVLRLYISDEFFSDAPEEKRFLLAPAVVDILYEDDNILLADKKPGLLVHEDESEQVDTLIHRIQHYLYDKGEYRPEEEHVFAPALCNRIDRNTGGIVIAAKNAASLRILNQKIKDRELHKKYLCIVHGQLPRPSDTLRAYMVKDENKNQVEVFDSPAPGRRTMVTKYRVLDEKGRFSLLEVNLITGRTHQIRAHMAHIGHPLLGDTKYGRNRDNRDTGFRYQALYSYALTFSFSTDAGILSYLDGKTFTVPDVWFQREFEEGKIH
ncbi:RluA family pseudouridine synthase [Zongyangia hominis]|uniref:Pseudouridine synthase n=1 Tax=Zongyangia hominis TaxID=2763677 RepID=A0A926ECL3_9FIRM|nr:RluA family pseudouridine synthase [Zongyangia hominis]MBC8569661.1 RluA family pseudouridine synthase [Zongyangia hominis]